MEDENHKAIALFWFEHERAEDENIIIKYVNMNCKSLLYQFINGIEFL